MRLLIDRSSHKKLTLILLLLLAVLVFVSNKQDENAPYDSNSPHHKSPEYAQKFYDRTLSLISSGYERISSYSNKVCDSNNWGSTSNVWILETMVRHSLPTLLQCTLESYASKYPESCIRVLYLNSNSSLDLVRANLSVVLNRHFNNIELVHMTAEELFKDTPVESLMPNISKARYKAVHISDIARVVLIYKYGGVYSDADIILRRKPEFGPKFFTRSGASGMLINAAFAYPKGIQFCGVFYMI
ncbi:alpha-1,4-N-acetylglucosaminyltransferase-like [Convolutriloba macropyga]|uniref:alpha-1,4-N-acetylglucosaminyltransferase-like n=1 Tax=Convolutriloba macropyga TaxID=536237 RepID=UPI003F522AA9